MKSKRTFKFRTGLVVALLSAAAVLLSGCGADMHDMHEVQLEEDGEAIASLSLRATGGAAGPALASATGDAALAEGAAPAAPATLQLGGAMALTRFGVGMNQVALRPTDGSGAATRLDGAHMADLLSDPTGHRMGPLRVPGGLSYQMELALWPMTGLDPRDPAAAWAMVLELTYVEPVGGFTHTFVLRWGGPGAFDMHGPAGVMLGGGGHDLMLDFRMEQVFATSYNGGSLVDALLATPMDADGVHFLDAAVYPDMLAVVLAALHDAMDFGEDMNRDGHLDAADDHMVGHSGSGCGGSML